MCATAVPFSARICAGCGREDTKIPYDEAWAQRVIRARVDAGSGNDGTVLQEADVRRWLGYPDSQPLPPGFLDVIADAGVGYADLLRSFAEINSETVRVAANAYYRSATIADGHDFANFVLDRYSAKGDAWIEKATSRIDGYTGENRFFDLMRADHEVEPAPKLNTPVWDFKVDGHEVNVKTWPSMYDHGESLNTIAAQHPDVTYAVPEDIHGTVSAPNIERVNGLSYADIHSQTEHALNAAQGADAFEAMLHHVPLITLAFTVRRKRRAVRQGQPVKTAVRHGSIEVAAKSGGALAGAQAGFKAGAAVGGHHGAVIGLLGGGVAGGMFGREVATAIEREELRAPLRALQQALREIGASGISGTGEVIAALHDHQARRRQVYEDLESAAIVATSSQAWLIEPATQTAAVVIAAEEARLVWHQAVIDAAPLTATIELANGNDLAGLGDWGDFLTRNPGLAKRFGVSLAMLARAHARRVRYDEARLRVLGSQQEARFTGGSV